MGGGALAAGSAGEGGHICATAAVPNLPRFTAPLGQKKYLTLPFIKWLGPNNSPFVLTT